MDDLSAILASIFSSGTFNEMLGFPTAAHRAGADRLGRRSGKFFFSYAMNLNGTILMSCAARLFRAGRWESDAWIGASSEGRVASGFASENFV